MSSETEIEHVLSQSSYPFLCGATALSDACNVASKLVSQLRLLDLDIMIVPHHEEVDTFIALHAARHANIKARVLEMPNIFGNGNHFRMCAAASVVVFPSCFAAHHDLSAECRRSGTSIVVIPPVGLDMTAEKSSSSFNKDTFTVVYSSRLSSERSVGIFLHTACVLRDLTSRTFERFRFILLGDGVQMQGIRNVVSAWNLNSYVEIRGAVTNQEVHRVLREEADAYLNPQFGETFGIGVIEAMSHGVPPIVCDSGGTSENVEDEVTGLVVNCSDYENPFDIAHRFARILLDFAYPISENSVRYDRISAQARIRSHLMYGRDSFAVQYGSLYEFLLW